MSTEHSDEQIVDVVDEGVEAVDDNAVEIDADSLAAAAQNAGITDADVQEAALAQDDIEENAATEDSDEALEPAEATVEISDSGDEESPEGGEEKEVIELVTSICTEDGVEVTVESVVEAILFASDEPITPNRLVGIVETGSVKQIRDCVKSLNEKYEKSNSAFRIERIAGGYQMMTLDAYNHWLRKMIRVRADNKLTQAALETLAIVAYKQPIMRADVEGIRGVSSGEMIRSLMYKGLVRITGRAEVLGRPMLYGTTKKFLDVFGLNTAKDLPKIDELKKPQE